MNRRRDYFYLSIIAVSLLVILVIVIMKGC
jgi:hypothetical protein